MPFERIDHPDIEDLLRFAERRLWKPTYALDLARRFLTELVSGHEFIFDLHDSAGRAAAAVLLDRVNNPSNDTCLEILGVRPDIDQCRAVTQLVELARNHVPEFRSGFQVALYEETTAHAELLKSLGLTHYYDSFSMMRDGVAPTLSFPQIRPATLSDADMVYDVLAAAFRHSPDTGIAEREVWKTGFLKTPSVHVYVWLEDGEIVAFAILVTEESEKKTEVRTIGVLEKFRGRGIGESLLRHCLCESARLGFSSCGLSVAARNERALSLYKRAGFRETGKYMCFRADAPKRARL